MTEPLRLVGYWKERGSGDVWPHPRELIDESWEPVLRPKIVEYLKSGIRIHEELGHSHCRFRNGPPDCEMGNAELTDGVWVWPEGLYVYVERYHVRLPNEFVEHMKSHAFIAASHADLWALERRGVDTRFWTTWCARNSRRKAPWWHRLFGR